MMFSMMLMAVPDDFPVSVLLAALVIVIAGCIRLAMLATERAEDYEFDPVLVRFKPKVEEALRDVEVQLAERDVPSRPRRFVLGGPLTLFQLPRNNYHALSEELHSVELGRMRQALGAG